MHFVRMLPSRVSPPAAVRFFRASARTSATPMSPLEESNHLEPVYAAIEERLSAVRKMYVFISRVFHRASPSSTSYR